MKKTFNVSLKIMYLIFNLMILKIFLTRHMNGTLSLLILQTYWASGIWDTLLQTAKIFLVSYGPVFGGKNEPVAP